MKNLVPGRIAALQGKLREMELDAAMIYDRENLIYLPALTIWKEADWRYPPRVSRSCSACGWRRAMSGRPAASKK